MNLFNRYKLLMTESDEKFKTWFGKSILKHPSGKPVTYYHGSGQDIEKFDHKFIGKGNDAYGTGFYFTNRPDVASNYVNGPSPNVMPVHIRLENPIHHDDETPLKRHHIEAIIKAAPNHIDTLSNFGDVKFEGYRKVLNAAVDTYQDHSKFDGMNTLHNDFYQGHHDKFLNNFKKITGHDGVIVKKPDDHNILSIFHPSQIKSAISSTYSRRSNLLTK